MIPTYFHLALDEFIKTDYSQSSNRGFYSNIIQNECIDILMNIKEGWIINLIHSLIFVQWAC